MRKKRGLPMEFHEAAHLFPLEEETIGELADDIRERGQLVTIKVMGGKILDGRRRWLACERAKVQPRLEAVDVLDPVAYAVSLNLKRRNLKPSQAAMVGAKVRDIYAMQAKERQLSGLKRGDEKPVVANWPQRETGKARDKAAEAVGVGGRTIDRATRVLKKGEPEVIAAVEQGRMAISTAAAVVDEPPEVQREVAAAAVEGNRRPRQKSAMPAQEPEGGNKWIKNVNEAIDRLKKIPMSSPFRRRCLQAVLDWARAAIREIDRGQQAA